MICLNILQDILEIQADAINPGDKVVIIDDLIATGGKRIILFELFIRVLIRIFFIDIDYLESRPIKPGKIKLNRIEWNRIKSNHA